MKETIYLILGITAFIMGLVIALYATIALFVYVSTL